ncbi:cation transporter E1-E2 family ATPase [Streptococcus pneumoniae]|nr:cation transporter E1-E2 family ATPase [Streptococcus pneumoniae]
MAFQNSNVTYGRGMGVVVNTGMYTEAIVRKLLTQLMILN